VFQCHLAKRIKANTCEPTLPRFNGAATSQPREARRFAANRWHTFASEKHAIAVKHPDVVAGIMKLRREHESKMIEGS